LLTKRTIPVFIKILRVLTTPATDGHLLQAIDTQDVSMISRVTETHPRIVDVSTFEFGSGEERLSAF